MAHTGGPVTFKRVMELERLASSTKVPVQVGSWPVLLIRTENAVHALLNSCPHAGAALTEARIRRGAIICPAHGGAFLVTDGQCVGGAYPPLLTFETRVSGGWVEVDLPDEPPSADLLPI
jgi:nitrite reductase/ring-hydroxylating ferredoxin subunit